MHLGKNLWKNSHLGKEHEAMVNNCNYDLIETISIISKSLARYDTYMKDCQHQESCQRIWSKIKDNREKELNMLVEGLKSIVEKGELSAEEQKMAA